MREVDVEMGRGGDVVKEERRREQNLEEEEETRDSAKSTRIQLNPTRFESGFLYPAYNCTHQVQRQESLGGLVILVQ